MTVPAQLGYSRVYGLVHHKTSHRGHGLKSGGRIGLSVVVHVRHDDVAAVVVYVAHDSAIVVSQILQEKTSIVFLFDFFQLFGKAERTADVTNC